MTAANKRIDELDARNQELTEERDNARAAPASTLGELMDMLVEHLKGLGVAERMGALARIADRIGISLHREPGEPSQWIQIQ